MKGPKASPPPLPLPPSTEPQNDAGGDGEDDEDKMTEIRLQSEEEDEEDERNDDDKELEETDREPACIIILEERIEETIEERIKSAKDFGNFQAGPALVWQVEEDVLHPENGLLLCLPERL